MDGPYSKGPPYCMLFEYDPPSGVWVLPICFERTSYAELKARVSRVAEIPRLFPFLSYSGSVQTLVNADSQLETTA